MGGFNEKEIWPTVKYAIDNIDVVRGVNFQPVALTARIPDKDRFQMRFTQSDLVRILCTEGPFEKSDFFPVPSVAPISELTSIIHGEEKMTLTTHPGCGCATFAFVSKDGQKITPLPRFMDVDGFFENVESMIEKYRDARFSRVRTAVAGARLLHDVAKFFDFSKAPEGLSEKNCVRVIAGIFTGGSKEAVAKFTWQTMYIGNMHFQDAYDYDIQRLMRCDIHYAVPDGRVIPFCSYNSGPILPDGGRAEVLDPHPRVAGGEEAERPRAEDARDDGRQRRGHRRPRVLQDPGAQGRAGHDVDLGRARTRDEPFPSPFLSRFAL